jgi:alanine dehydrogenase
VARTSTFALNNATIGPGLALADQGWQAAMRANAHLRAGLNVANGKVTFEAVAQALGYDYTPANALLS